jgi:hypothetical protein
MFEQAFRNIDALLWKEAGCTTERSEDQFDRWRTSTKASLIEEGSLKVSLSSLETLGLNMD